MNHRGSSFRLRLVAVLCVLPLVATLAMTFYLQVLISKSLQAKAESQQVHRVREVPHRGSILDRNGKELAYSMVNYSLLAETEKVKDPKGTAKILAQALNVPAAPLEKRLRSKRKHVELWTRVTPLMERHVDLSQLPGITERSELKRIYPYGESAAHVVGYVGSDRHGLGGAEKTFEDLLRGQPGWSTELRDGKGRSYPAMGLPRSPAIEGQTVQLTIDAALQDIVASSLRKGAERLSAKGGVAIAVDPATGEILALASYPSFDPSSLYGVTPEQFCNLATVAPFEPGSTFKLVAAAAALTDNLMAPSTPIHCENGRYTFNAGSRGAFSVRDHHHYGVLSFREAFAKSSNIAFAKIGRRLDHRLEEMARDFGFGVPTGIPAGGESAGLIYPHQNWSGRSSATLAYGYEVMATPIQICMAYAAVANGGVLMEPQLVRSVRSPEGEETFHGAPRVVRQVVSREVAATLRWFMRSVVEDGTATEANVDWVEVAGKTGTTEKLVFNPATGRKEYSTKKHYASFVGMAPADAPRFVCMVMLDEPAGSVYGGSAAAPIFKEILEASSRLPGAWLSPEYPLITVAEPPTTRAAPWQVSVATANEIEVTISGTLPLHEGLPDVRNQSIRQALMILRGYRVPVEVHGTGHVVEQTVHEDGDQIVVVLQGSRPGTEATVVSAAARLVRPAGKENSGTEKR